MHRSGRHVHSTPTKHRHQVALFVAAGSTVIRKSRVRPVRKMGIDGIQASSGRESFFVGAGPEAASSFGMKTWIVSTAVFSALLGACAASLPPPTQRMADAESAERSARELGANSEPVAQLSLKLASEQIAQAKTAMASGDNSRANSLLLRAKADAELAIAEAREKGAKQADQKAVEDSAAQTNTNAAQGAAK